MQRFLTVFYSFYYFRPRDEIQISKYIVKITYAHTFRPARVYQFFKIHLKCIFNVRLYFKNFQHILNSKNYMHLEKFTLLIVLKYFVSKYI